MHKAVIFDLGGVVVPLDFDRAYAAIGERCPHPAPEVRKRIGATGLVEKLEMGQIEPEAFAAAVARALDVELPYPEFCELWGALFPPHTLIPEEFLAALRARYRLLLLSNTNGIHFPYVERNYPLLRHFNDFVLSYRVGAMKPDPEIYREAVRRAGCLAGECFFTDDLAANVEGALREGLDAARFESFETLTRQLADRGITAGG